MRNYPSVVIIILLSLIFQNIKAQETPELELDPIAVTASLYAQKASRTGRNVLIIPGERFNDLPVHSLDELLRYLPGIEVQMRGPAGSQSDIVLRGGTFQHVLVIIDGARVNDANSGHFTSYIPVVPAEIERVEILKGASSAIYGSDAVGGVIHIITRSFSKRQLFKKSSIRAKATAGEYKLIGVDAGFLVSSPKSILNGGFLSNSSDGQPQRGTRGYFHNKTASLSYGRSLNPSMHVAIRTSWDDRDFAAQNFYTNFVSDTSSERVKTSWSQLQFTHIHPKRKVQLDVGYKFLEDRFAFNSVSVANLNKSYLLQGLLTTEWSLKEHVSVLTSGLQFINKRINSNDRGNHNIDQAGIFLLLNQLIGNYFTITPGIRLDWNERSGTELVPQVNLSYRIDRWQFRGSAGKTIRDADFTERFNNYGRPLVTSGRIGNPDLVTERSFSFEAGVDFLREKPEDSFLFFQRHHHDLIDYVVTPYADMPRKDNLSPTGMYALAKNIAKVTTTGVETDIQFSKKISDKHSIWSTLGCVWLETKSSELIPSFYISSHAKWLLNFNTNYSWNWLSVGLNGLYKKRSPQAAANPAIAKVSADYFVLNLKLEAKLLKERLAAFTQIDNLFDRNYVDILGSQMPGRWFMAGLSVQFRKGEFNKPEPPVY